MFAKREDLTRRLATSILSLYYDDLPGAVVERTKQLLLDLVGVACGGKAETALSTPLLQAVSDLCGGQVGPATVIGERAGFPPQYAALVNSAYGHAMDFDDTHLEARAHPGTLVFPTLLALAETNRVSGRQFLTAAVAGYEAACRLGKVHREKVHDRGFHPTATTGIFGATAAGARLLDLPEEVLLNAWGLNLSQSAGTLQYLENGAWNKSIHTGLAAHNAIVALTMARRGIVGSAQPFDGRFGYYRCFAGDDCDPGSALKGLGEQFELLRTAVKPYPCCRCLHSAIDAIMALAGEHDLNPAAVAEITVAMNQTCLMQVAEPLSLKRAPETVVDAQFSVFFAAAVALVDRAFTWDSYRRLRDPEIQALAARTRAVEAPIPGLGAHVAITLEDGERLVAEVMAAKGEPESFFTPDEMLEKFRSLALKVLSGGQVERVAAVVGRLEELPDVAILGANLRG